MDCYRLDRTGLLETARHQKGLLETKKRLEGPSKNRRGYHYIVTMMDMASRFPEAIEMQMQHLSLHKPVGMVLFPNHDKHNAGKSLSQSVLPRPDFHTSSSAPVNS